MTIGPSTLRLPEGPWSTVFECLCAHFASVTRAEWAARFARGRVLDADHRALAIDHPYRVGLTVRYFREVANEPRIPFSEVLVHVDEHLVVADKPHFLPVTPAGRFAEETLLGRLVASLGNRELVPLHRIDRGTAGLVVFSARADTRSCYQALFRTGKLCKIYEAIAAPLSGLDLPHRRASRIVRGTPFFRMEEQHGPANAVTVIESCGLLEPAPADGRGRALYRLRPLTGRKHQLRVHMAALGAPIDGDSFYPTLDARLLPAPREPGSWQGPQDDYARPLALLARKLAFVDPLTGEPREFDSTLRLHENGPTTSPGENA